MENRTQTNLQNNEIASDFKEKIKAEANLKPWRRHHSYFHLTTRKIALMAMILASNLVLTLFSRFVLGLAPLLGFFVIEVSFFSVLIFARLNNLFYSVIFLEATIWFRLVLGSEPIGLLAMNLVDGFFLLFFYGLNFIFRKLMVKKNDYEKTILSELISLFIVILATSSLAVLINYSFLLSLYYPWWNKKQIIFLLPIIFGLNLIKYSVNSLIYLLTIKPLIVLARRHNN